MRVTIPSDVARRSGIRVRLIVTILDMNMKYEYDIPHSRLENGLGASSFFKCGRLEKLVMSILVGLVTLWRVV